MSRGFRRRESDGSGETIDEALSPPSRSSSPIYERSPHRNWDLVPKRQGPKLIRDRLFDLMMDEGWHTALDLESALPHGEWVRAMRELIDDGYAFDRWKNSLRMRRRRGNEVKQVLVSLLAGIDATDVSEPPKKRDFSSDREVSESDDGTFDVEADDDGMVEDSFHLSEERSAVGIPAADATTMTTAILAQKGAGKTYLAMVLAEEMMGCSSVKIPVVIIDPVGVWWGLRASADGGPSGLGIVTLGGKHADVAISHAQGRNVAKVVHEMKPTPFLLDLSRMRPSQQHEFVADFGEQIFSLAEGKSVHIIVEEADEFVPQVLSSTSTHHRRCLEAIDRVVRRGRTKGLGTTLITQRTAVISKNIISQIGSLYLLNMVAPIDLDYVDEWMKRSVSAKHRVECLNALPNLPPGTSYFVQYGLHHAFRRFQVRTKRTYDSSRTLRGNEEISIPELERPSVETIASVERWMREPIEDDLER